MNGAQALAFFAMELARASAEVGVAPPRVVPIYVHERLPTASSLVLAYLVPCPRDFECGRPSVHVMWHVLWGGNKEHLRCIARHEVTHVLLGHGRGVPDGDAQLLAEEQVKVFMRMKWKQDSRCRLK